MSSTIAPPSAGTMKALVQEGYGSADVLHLREVERPAITDERVLVRVRAASVNALDYHSVHGGRLTRAISTLMRQKELPIRGVDVSGVVEVVGANVTALRPGDEVFGCGSATFAEYATGSTRGLLPKPRGLSFTEAGAMGVAGLTALQAVRDHGHAGAGKRVLIYGAGGGVGTFAVQIGKALGAHVTAVTGPANLEIVRRLGADAVLDYTSDDPTRRGERYDAVIDIAAIRPIPALRKLLTPDGILVMVGADKRGSLAIFSRLGAGLFRARVLKQRVVFFIAKTRAEDLAFLKELAESGKLRPAIDREFPLSEAREAVRYAEGGHARAKVVITIP